MSFIGFSLRALCSSSICYAVIEQVLLGTTESRSLDELLSGYWMLGTTESRALDKLLSGYSMLGTTESRALDKLLSGYWIVKLRVPGR